MTAGRRVGILGGTFDPIHCGHLDVGAAAQAALDLADVLVLPSYIPPHRPQTTASGYHRFAMVSMAIAGRHGWRAVDLELREAERSYTSTTLRRFHREGFSAAELFFIIGADAFADIVTWRDYPALLDLAHFAVVSRPGLGVPALAAQLPSLASRMCTPHTTARTIQSTLIFLIDRPTADVSSTAIRQARARGESIAGLVTPNVQQHIEQHALYQYATGAAEAAATEMNQPAGRLHG